MNKGSESPADCAGAGQTLFEFVRHWSRRWNAPIEASAAQNGRHVLVIEAVNSLSKREAASINDVAREIGIDQSGASRLVKEAVGAGYLTLQASEADARRREIILTAAGHDLLLQAHDWQEEIFKHLTEEWVERERTEFHRAMLRMLDRSRAIGP